MENFDFKQFLSGILQKPLKEERQWDPTIQTQYDPNRENMIMITTPDDNERDFVRRVARGNLLITNGRELTENHICPASETQRENTANFIEDGCVKFPKRCKDCLSLAKSFKEKLIEELGSGLTKEIVKVIPGSVVYATNLECPFRPEGEDVSITLHNKDLTNYQI